MISTKELQLLPDSNKLRELCKALSVLDAILCQDWVYRYYSYNSEWSADEEFFEMRNGEGDQLLVLFNNAGTVINGYSTESAQEEKDQLTHGLPEVFHEFIFGEPVNSAGTTFCLWKTHGQEWKTGTNSGEDNHSEEMLSPLDGNPATYVKWAADYFKGSYHTDGISLDTVTKIYNQEPLTRDMILSLVEDLEDWEQLIDDLLEISYPHLLNS